MLRVYPLSLIDKTTRFTYFIVFRTYSKLGENLTVSTDQLVRSGDRLIPSFCSYIHTCALYRNTYKFYTFQIVNDCNELFNNILFYTFMFIIYLNRYIHIIQFVTSTAMVSCKSCFLLLTYRQLCYAVSKCNRATWCVRCDKNKFLFKLQRLQRLNY